VDGRRGCRRVNRGEIWTASVGGKVRPVLVLTRDSVIDVRELVTVAEVTTVVRGISAEVGFEWESAGLTRESVINCDGIHTVRRRDLTGPVGEVSDSAMNQVCAAVSYAIGC
jgi:mRNA interferase MazF